MCSVRMKALSILQPWAWLIAAGHKDIENRKWSTTFRGSFLIHAGKGFDTYGYRDILHRFPEIEMPDLADFERGGIVGAGELVDCVQLSKSPWFNGPHGFVIRNARELEFTPWRGQLGWFEVPTDQLAEAP